MTFSTTKSVMALIWSMESNDRKMKDSDNREILFCFTVDTDSDAFFGDRFPKGDPGDKSIAGWEGLERGKELLCEIADGMTDSYGNRLAITWFVRCDYQIKAQYAQYGYLLSRYEDLWRQRIEVGDDIQWHAHLYRLEGNALEIVLSAASSNSLLPHVSITRIPPPATYLLKFSI